MSGRTGSAVDDPFLKLQWMIRYEAGLTRDLILRGQGDLEWERAGYSVYSQFDEDGLIQYLLSKVSVDEETFVEIGIEDYRQSNTRYLLEKSNWTGMIYDCVSGAEALLDTLDLRTLRTIEFQCAMISVENVNQVVDPGAKLGLLSLDIDSQDYFVLQALEARPSILILEYNTAFGADADVSVPEQVGFDRFKHHYSGLCFGASLKALTRLADEKGYSLVGCSSGPNAFYVRKDLLGGLAVKTPREAIRPARFRESRGPNGEFTYLSTVPEKLAAMRDAQIFDFESGAVMSVGQKFGV
jgi:hypothetical protein